MKKVMTQILLVLLVLPGFLCWPIDSLAADKMMAVIITGDLPRYKTAHESFMKILRKGGMTEDKVEVFVQRPNPDPMSWANAVRKAVGVGVDVIVTYGAPATLVAKKQARGIPVLFADVGDPVALGLVKGLATPGGDITGISSMTPLDTLLKNFISVYKAKMLGIIYSKEDKEAAMQVKMLQKASGKYGFKVKAQSVKSCKDVIPAFDGMGGSVDSIYVPHCAALEPSVEQLVDAALAAKVPVISQSPGLVEKGALMTLVADPVEQGQLIGVHAIQVLNGQKAFTLPVRTPKKVAFVVNMKSAKALGLKVPISTLENATKVIK